MVFCFFPDKASSLPVARGITQIINSYAVNMRPIFMLGILLYSRLYIDTCTPWIWVLSENSQLIGKKLKTPVYDTFKTFLSFTLPVNTCH